MCRYIWKYDIVLHVKYYIASYLHVLTIYLVARVLLYYISTLYTQSEVNVKINVFFQIHIIVPLVVPRLKSVFS